MPISSGVHAACLAHAVRTFIMLRYARCHARYMRFVFSDNREIEIVSTRERSQERDQREREKEREREAEREFAQGSQYASVFIFFFRFHVEQDLLILFSS